MPSIGYLGPRGTFTQEALEANLADRYDSTVSFGTVREVLMAAEADEVDCGLVPIENSIEGSVNVTLDTLTFDTHLFIEVELIHPVSHQLVSRPDVPSGDIAGVVSHPHASAQCRRFLSENLPGIPVIAANSTAEAARTVSESDKPLAAIANELSADIYGLNVISSDIADYRYNLTRFVVAGKKAVHRTGYDKTSVACFIRENRPGSLLEILREFASRGVNLTKIESRPTKKVLGEYYFFIDVEGHLEDEAVSSALESLGDKLREIKILGSYPAADLPAYIPDNSGAE